MKGRTQSWRTKNLVWHKRYKKYREEVLRYEYESQKSYALHNAIVFMIYGIVCFSWDKYALGESPFGGVLCLLIALYSLTDFIVCKLYIKTHIEYSAISTNIYILILIKSIMSLDLVWNDCLGGNVSWTLLLCSILTTAIISIVPTQYTLIIIVMVVTDTIESAIKCDNIVDVLYNILDSTLIAIFCISINIMFSVHQYAEFYRKDELKLESNRDLLTQLYNRRYIERYYALSAESDRLCAMLMLDLDNFKMANDLFGHKKGDEVLCMTADILRSNFRGTDCVARLGGDEFAVFLSDISNKEMVVDRVHAVLSNFPLIIDGDRRVEVSVSIGIAYKDVGESVEYSKLCDKADTAMYMAKRLGKGKAVVCPERNTRAVIIVA
jgi:diguanylate cyclase (GGDEF)-like protein